MRGYLFVLRSLGDAQECPAAAVVIAFDAELTVAVGHRKDLCNLLTLFNDRSQAAIDKLDTATLELHSARDDAHIASKAHARNGNWYVHLIFHFLFPLFGKC
jgi:hypothetical protein